MIEIVKPAQQQPLDQHAAGPDDDRGQDEGPPIVYAGILQRHVGRKGSHHVLGAVSEIDDVQEAEDHSQAQAKHGVEGAVDKPEEQLSEQDLRGDADQFKHAVSLEMERPIRQQEISSSSHEGIRIYQVIERLRRLEWSPVSCSSRTAPSTLQGFSPGRDTCRASAARLRGSSRLWS